MLQHDLFHLLGLLGAETDFLLQKICDFAHDGFLSFSCVVGAGKLSLGTGENLGGKARLRCGGISESRTCPLPVGSARIHRRRVKLARKIAGVAAFWEMIIS
jgi:hypothetical protein